MELLYVLGSIAGGFVVLLIIKHQAKLRFCVVCVSVSLTWVTLLGLYWLDIFTNTTILALLMGQSIIGLYYLAERHLAAPLMIFRLPGLLTLTYIFYSAIEGITLPGLWLLLGLWLLAGMLFLYRQQPWAKSTVDHILACCRDW